MSKDLIKKPIFIVQNTESSERKREMIKILEKSNLNQKGLNSLNEFTKKLKIYKQEENDFKNFQSSSFTNKGITNSSMEDENNFDLNENSYYSSEIKEKINEKNLKDFQNIKDQLIILFNDTINNKLLEEKTKEKNKDQQKSYNKIFSSFYDEGSKYFNNKQLQEIYNEILEIEINEYFKFLNSLEFISPSYKLQYLYFFKKAKNKEIKKFIKFSDSRDNIIKRDIFNKNNNEIIQYLKNIPRVMKNKKNKNRKICFHCLQYYNKLSKHIFSTFNNKCCKKLYKYIIKEKKFENQMKYFVHIIKFAKQYYRAYRNKDIIKEITLMVKKTNIQIPLKNFNDYNQFFKLIYIKEFGYYFKKTLDKLSQYKTIYEINLNKIFKSLLNKLDDKNITISEEEEDEKEDKILREKYENYILHNSKIKDEKNNKNSNISNNYPTSIIYSQKSILEKDYVIFN